MKKNLSNSGAEDFAVWLHEGMEGSSIFHFYCKALKTDSFFPFSDLLHFGCWKDVVLFKLAVRHLTNSVMIRAIQKYMSDERTIFDWLERGEFLSNWISYCSKITRKGL